MFATVGASLVFKMVIKYVVVTSCPVVSIAFNENICVPTSEALGVPDNTPDEAFNGL